MDSVLYHGQTAEVATEENDDDANVCSFPVSSGFTAINHPQTQLLTPGCSAVASARPGQPSSRAIGNPPPRHKPEIARYLGLDNEAEPVHLGIYAPRSRRVECQTMHRRPASLTRCIPQRPWITDDSNTGMPITDNPMSHFAHPEDFPHVTARATFDLETMPMISQNAVEAPHAEHVHLPLLGLGDDTALDTSPDSKGKLLCRNNNDVTPNGDDNDYDFDITDDELLILTFGSCSGVPHCLSNLSAESYNNNGKKQAGDEFHDKATEEAPAISKSPKTCKKFVSPVTSTTGLLAVNRDEGTAQARKPIVRSPFPKPVRDRSPIIGLSYNVVLRTCFRIGEAINQSHQASKTGQQITIELYARVLASERTETQQYFTFCDLFHVRPPYIRGAYDAAIWKAVPLFEYDSRRLLQPGRMCRCIGVMRHSRKQWSLTIHNIWEATWDDIQWAEGIVCS